MELTITRKYFKVGKSLKKPISPESSNMRWKTREGIVMLAKDMGTTHIVNTINLLKRQNSHRYRDCIKAFKTELEFRVALHNYKNSL